MPTYEYACKACGHVFEIVQKMSDDPLVICPECGGELRKVFAPPAISFKGSGFYATDHGKKSKTSTNAAGSSGDEGDTGGASDKGEKGSKDSAGGGPKESTSSEGSSSSSNPSTKEGTSS